MRTLPGRYQTDVGKYLSGSVAGEGEKDDIELLLELAETISATALCVLGKSAASPVVGTTIERFPG